MNGYNVLHTPRRVIVANSVENFLPKNSKTRGKFRGYVRTRLCQDFVNTFNETRQLYWLTCINLTCILASFEILYRDERLYREK